ncbi:MAG: glycosyltransferase [Bacteroidota bacterium]
MNKKILIAPLDWGLGHATRCIPLVEELIFKGAKITLAGSGGGLTLLKEQYPNFPSLELPAYRVRYSARSQQVGMLIRQLPRLLRVIQQERQILAQWIRKHPQDGIISDNRYGCWNAQIPCVFLCHQLNPLLPSPLARFQGSLFHLHRRFLRPFQEIWIPDYAPPDSLSGRLSQPGVQLEKALFIGPLSRFSKFTSQTPGFYTKTLRGNPPFALAILSGPEPQRSLLEAQLLKQAESLEHSLWIIQGKWDRTEPIIKGNCTLIPHMHQQDLYLAIQSAQYIISRSGYSSIMDYEALGVKRSILIPTPGQSEQEYLGEKLHKEKVALCVRQNHLNLPAAFEQVLECKGFERSDSANHLSWKIDKWLTSL